MTDKTGELVSLWPTQGGEELFVLSEGGILIRTKVDQVSSYGRSSQGVTIMRMDAGDRVVQAIVLPADDQVAQVAQAIVDAAPSDEGTA